MKKVLLVAAIAAQVGKRFVQNQLTRSSGLDAAIVLHDR